MIPLCHILIQKKSIIVSNVTEILRINVISIDFNEAFEFIFKNDYLD